VSACAQSAEETFDLDFSGNGTTEKDLNGFEMKYAISTATLFGDQNAENVLGYTTGTLFADAAAKRKSDIEKAYNCKISPFYASEGANVNSFITYSMSGVFYSDAIQGNADTMRPGTKVGIYQSINGMNDYIDYLDSDKWGTCYMLEGMCYGGNLYGILPAAWPELNYSSFGYPIVANMNLASTVGIPDLRETVENKEWTWDKFEETLVAGTIIEGTETKTYGMTCHPPYLGEMMVRSNGDTVIKETPDGKYYWGYSDQHALAALQEFRDIYIGEYKYCSNHKISEPDPVADSFIAGEAVLAVVDTEQIFGYNGRISQYVENYAILPAPVGPDRDPSDIFSVHESMRSMIAFSVLSKNIDSTAFIIDKIYEPFEGYETKDKIMEYMTEYYFFDERDANVFFKMFENTSYNYFIVGMRGFTETVFKRENKTVAELVDIDANKYQTLIEEEAVSPRETMKELWPEEFKE